MMKIDCLSHHSKVFINFLIVFIMFSLSSCEFFFNPQHYVSNDETDIDTQPPSVPENLDNRTILPHSYQIIWEASSDNVAVAGYHIYRNGLYLADSISNSYTDTSVVPDTGYAYQVSAYDVVENESGLSDITSGRTPEIALLDTEAPTIPENLTAGIIEPESFPLSWDASTDNVAVAGYYIYRDGVYLADIATNTYTDITVSGNKEYTYRISAYDTAGNVSGLSDPVTGTTPDIAAGDNEAPSVPQNLTATDIQPYRVSFSWNASSDNIGVTGYRIYRNEIAIDETASTWFNDTYVLPETAYTYRVSAYDAANNESGLSEALFVTTTASSSGSISNLGDVDISNPSSTVKLCFIHHSCGFNWLLTGDGNLGQELNSANYYVTETDYDWDAELDDNLGTFTDTVHWSLWFNDIKLPYVYNNSSHYAFTNTISDPGGENTIIMFKSCYPNSGVGDSIEDEKDIYNALLSYFADHTDKLFILVVPPPMIEIPTSSLTRELANWLADYENGWLANYPAKNVFAFDFFNILTDPNNHHRVEGNSIVHTVSSTPVDAANPDELYYYTGSDSHPTKVGNQKATEEFIPVLNAIYNYWRE